MKKPVVLMILDGFGIREQEAGNAVKKAHLPHFNELMEKCPNTQLQASGLAVGLPEGQMGNSEVGHLNIGAGRVVYQELTRITKSIKDGEFLENNALVKAVKHVKSNGQTLHLMGLVSDGGVHSHMDHLFGLLEMAAVHNVKNVVVHCFLDGRDTPPQSALTYVADLEEKINSLGVGRIGIISGRYYAMDRDKRWERLQLAYDALVLGEGLHADTAAEAIQTSYDRGEHDEFVKPTVIGNDPEGLNRIKPDDAVIFFNFRPDRAREMTRALIDEEFDGFKRPFGKIPLLYVTMTQYDKTITGTEVAYPPQSLNNTLGETVSHQGGTQLRIAETEKYAHVTYFLNGGVEVPFEGEDRILIPSSKIATYDQKPEMSAGEVTDALLNRLDQNDLNLVVLNYANPDMVGHTGVMEAVVKALETVDECMHRIVEKVLSQDGRLLITSDHGNAEELFNEETGEPVTSHTTNPVPLILVGMEGFTLAPDGRLCDLAPTLLEMMEMEKPEVMTGNSLLVSG
ncbi:MAG: 2,3-bisphosphoglycerate-independent phosphoglycerate mutase [Bacillota bacterium]|nr:2,3-bisphosphoglycerate-independent phosphoglycerate mutase [Bacillota bacterium]MDW7676301.1 2,3-bisphosphoglycerate-independent phosphoglycerate mutase [Bacillota bacterium]